MFRLTRWFRTARSTKVANKARAHRFQPLVETLEDRLCPSATTVLPISAFLAQQNHDNVFTPAAHDQLAWSNSAFDPGATATDPTRLLMVDYTGTLNQTLMQHGINLHTTVTGFVTETPVGTTGLMEVTVNLEATNALTWVANVANVDPNQVDSGDTAPLELGYRVQDLEANPSLKPALSSVNFQMTWQEDIGANLPDLARLNENYALYAPAGFSSERVDVQSFGTGTIDAGSTVGTPGQQAIVSTCQVADLTNGNRPGTLSDGYWQEPIDIVPVASAATHVAALNGTVYVMDTGNGNDNVQVTPGPNGGAIVSSNLGNGSFTAVTKVVVALGNGNNHVQIGNFHAATVDVVAFNGNNDINVGDVSKLLVHVGGGNNNIQTAEASAGQFICIGGDGNNKIDADNTTAAEILVAGNGNNNISATGTGDFIEMVGNGNNQIGETGANGLIWLGGDGNNDLDVFGLGDVIDILAGAEHNHGHCPGA